MTGDNIVLLVPATPLLTAALLTIVPNYRIGARINVASCLVTFVLGLLLLENRPEPGLFLHVDDFNIYLIALTAFVAFTTAIFSGSSGAVTNVEMGTRVAPARQIPKAAAIHSGRLPASSPTWLP